MSQKELSGLEVIQRLKEKRMKQIEAARMMGVSIRQLMKLLRPHRENRGAGLVSKRRG